MSLSSGTRLGPYEIIAPLGAGGMGEVYRARDTRLDRSVAIKVLPETLAADPQFRERFDREARAISQLTHPNICALYDVGEEAGTAYLVMELLDGHTLAARLERGALPVNEALTIAIQVASALDKAHHAGIVHRDLKPSNVMLTKSGARLLDFGLAKTNALTVAGVGLSMLPTTPPVTAQGTILGTLQYMAPEQLEGQEADARADIFAFGAILYELITGKKAFTGKSHASLIASILEHDPPPMAALQKMTPPALERLVQMCLAKDRDDRWQSAHDLMQELKWIAESKAEPTSGAGLRPTRTRERIGWLALVAALMAVIVYTQRAANSPSTDRSVTHLMLTAEPAERLAGNWNRLRPTRTAFALSPDGRTVVFCGIQGGVQQLFKRGLEVAEATAMPGTQGASGPFFSPDGQWVGFWADNKLKKAPLAGGPPVDIGPAPAEAGLFGASWGTDGSIVFSLRGEGISRISAGGGAATVLTTAAPDKSEALHILPQLLSGGTVILYTIVPVPRVWDDTQIVAQSLATGERRVLIQGGADARYVAGRLLYMKSGTLMAVPFDVDRLELTGAPVAIFGDVMQGINALDSRDETGAGQFTVSASGTLTYVPGGAFPDRQAEFVWVDRKGVVAPLPQLPRGNYFFPRVSPDGRRIAYGARRTQTPNSDLWVYDINRQNTTRLTSQGSQTMPVWSPDGNGLAFGMRTSNGVLNIARMYADGSGTPERMTTSPYVQYPSSWSAVANTVAFGEAHGTRGQIWILPMEGRREATSVLEVPVNQSPQPALSPNGEWLAYHSAETGSDEVYIQAYPGPGQRMRISSNGGMSVVWARNGRELFYQRDLGLIKQLVAVDIDTSNGIRVGKPRLLFEGPYQGTPTAPGYDVAPDGQRFIMDKPTYFDTPVTRMHILLNYLN